MTDVKTVERRAGPLDITYELVKRGESVRINTISIDKNRPSFMFSDIVTSSNKFPPQSLVEKLAARPDKQEFNSFDEAIEAADSVRGGF